MVAAQSQQGVLQRLIGPQARELPAEVARFFLDLSFSQAERERMAGLSEKANEGELSTDERDELSMYVVLNDFLTILQSRARASLKAQSPANTG